MKTSSVLLWFFAAVSCFCAEKQLSRQDVQKLPTDVQDGIAAFRSASGSNDWTAAQAEFARINWQDVERLAPVLAELSKSLPKDKSAAALRREIKTKYQLVRASGDPDLADTITSTPIPVLRLAPIDAPRVSAPELEPPVVLPDNDQVDDLVKLWQTRYAAEIGLRDSRGRIVPAPGSVLWAQRAALITAVAAGADYETLWPVYKSHLQTAIRRRNNLKKR